MQSAHTVLSLRLRSVLKYLKWGAEAMETAPSGPAHAALHNEITGGNENDDLLVVDEARFTAAGEENEILVDVKPKMRPHTVLGNVADHPTRKSNGFLSPKNQADPPLLLTAPQSSPPITTQRS